jgi:hypothetical protein
VKLRLTARLKPLSRYSAACATTSLKSRGLPRHNRRHKQRATPHHSAGIWPIVKKIMTVVWSVAPPDHINGSSRRNGYHTYPPFPPRTSPSSIQADIFHHSLSRVIYAPATSPTVGLLLLLPNRNLLCPALERAPSPSRCR